MILDFHDFIQRPTLNIKNVEASNQATPFEPMGFCKKKKQNLRGSGRIGTDRVDRSKYLRVQGARHIQIGGFANRMNACMKPTSNKWRQSRQTRTTGSLCPEAEMEFARITAHMHARCRFGRRSPSSISLTCRLQLDRCICPPRSAFLGSFSKYFFLALSCSHHSGTQS